MFNDSAVTCHWSAVTIIFAPFPARCSDVRWSYGRCRVAIQAAHIEHRTDRQCIWKRLAVPMCDLSTEIRRKKDPSVKRNIWNYHRLRVLKSVCDLLLSAVPCFPVRLLSRKKTETQARLQAVRDESITCFLAQICIFYTHKLQCENGIDLSLSLPPVHVWVSENRSRKFKHFPPRGAERWRGPGEGGASLFQGRHLFLQRKNLSKLRCANFQTGQVNIASHSDESLNRCVFFISLSFTLNWSLERWRRKTRTLIHTRQLSSFL